MFDDTNDVVETWSSLFLDIADKHLPLKQHRVKRQQQPKWLTGKIIDAIRTCDRYKSINVNLSLIMNNTNFGEIKYVI